ncbi:MAG: methionyl-tRNA formyltransferase [Acidocella sp.]|nr:methionyl-tRNA formyltransferase [Acidocella sp.]
MRIAFMGSPEFAVPALQALVAAGHEVAAVYAQPPKPAGRGQHETPCPVHAAALAMRLNVRTPKRLRGNVEEAEFFASLKLDIAVVAAYGLILPAVILSAPRLGCLNIHASLLPRWRGAAPIQAAILAGDDATGITIMQMDAGLDTGAMLLSEATPIGPHDTAADLHDRLAEIGGRLILRALSTPQTPKVQDDTLSTYAPKLSREDARLNFTKSAVELERQIRAYHPWPGSLALLGTAVIKFLAAEIVPGEGIPGEILDDKLTIACGEGALRPTLLQRAGKTPMSTSAFLRGFPVAAESRFF